MEEPITTLPAERIPATMGQRLLKAAVAGVTTFAGLSMLGMASSEDNTILGVTLNDGILVAGMMAAGQYVAEPIRGMIEPSLPEGIRNNSWYDMLAHPVIAVTAGALVYNATNVDRRTIGLDMGGFSLLGLSAVANVASGYIDNAIDPSTTGIIV